MKALFVTVDALRETIYKLGLTDLIDSSVFFQQLEQQVFKLNPTSLPSPPINLGSHSAMDAKQVKHAAPPAGKFATQHCGPVQQPGFPDLTPEDIAVRRKMVEEAVKDFKEKSMRQSSSDFIMWANQKSFSEPVVRQVNSSPEEIALRRKMIEKAEKDLDITSMRAMQQPDPVIQPSNPTAEEEIAVLHKQVEEAVAALGGRSPAISYSSGKSLGSCKRTHIT